MDFNLYNETFTGRAKALSCCVYCSSEIHSLAACSNVLIRLSHEREDLLIRFLVQWITQVQYVASSIVIEGTSAPMPPITNFLMCVQPVWVATHRPVVLLKCGAVTVISPDHISISKFVSFMYACTCIYF